MEYDWEQNDVPGDVPEFGAIFMSNIATKRECFKRKVFGLPSSMSNFVKKVKEGMVLFLFEFEKRQLFGVYQAASDGAINIVPHAFNSSGKQFPAQVHFTPIWSCRPLFENEFREAIRENYFSAKKFHFGLSEQQVRRLLQLFITRKVNDKLPPRQMTRLVTRPAGKDRRRVDRASSARREKLEMEHFEDDFTPADINEFLEYTPDRSIEADENRLFIDDKLENGKKMNSFGHNFLADEAVDFMHKRKRLHDNNAETELRNAHASLLSYGTGNQEVSLDKERIPAARRRSLRGENTHNDCNIYTSVSPANATKYTGGTSDLTRRADYERPLFEGTNRHEIHDCTFLVNDTIEKNLMCDSFMPMVSNENEEYLERPGRAAGDCRFFMNSRSGHKRHINDDINTIIPSENFNNSQNRVKGPSGDSKLLMDVSIASERNLDNGPRLGGLSEKPRNPFDSDQRRFLHRDIVMKSNYRDGVHGKTTSYVPSEYDRSIPRQTADDGLLSNNRVDNRHDIEAFLPPVSTKYTALPHLTQNSSDCLGKPSPDTKFSQLEGPQHFKNLNSTFHDSIVPRPVSIAPELSTFHHGLSLPIGVDRGASLVPDNPHYGTGGDSFALSKSKTFEREGFGGNEHPSDFRNENFHLPNHHFSSWQATQITQIPQSMELMSSAPASTFGMQKRNHGQESDERIGGNEAPSSDLSSAGLGIYHQVKHLTKDAVEFYKSYNTKIANDDGQHFLNPGGGYSDFEKQRRSVFTRLTSTSRVCTQEIEEKDALDKSVDEVVDILNSSQIFWMKNLRKCKLVVRPHDREELPRTEKRMSTDQAQPRFTTTELEEVSQAIKDGVDELQKETRAVEFKRRSQLKKDLDENSTKSNVLSVQESTSGDIHDLTSRECVEAEGPVNKPQKRRKLVRPVFSNNVSGDGVSDDQNLLSQSQSQSFTN